MKLKILAAVAATILAGCATTPSIPEPEELRSAVNAAYRGGPISAVIGRYGVPESQYLTDNDIRVLVWSADRTMRFHENVTTTTKGSVGDSTAYPFLESVPYRETTTSRQGYNVDMTCSMQVGVLDGGIVDGFGFTGKMGACQAFMP